MSLLEIVPYISVPLTIQNFGLSLPVLMTVVTRTKQDRDTIDTLKKRGGGLNTPCGIQHYKISFGTFYCKLTNNAQYTYFPIEKILYCSAAGVTEVKVTSKSLFLGSSTLALF